MSIRTFWNIVFKIMGIWFIISLLNFIPYTFSTLTVFLNDAYSDATFLIVCLLVIAFFISVIRLLIFRTDIIIDKLKLEKSFTEDRININIHSYQLLSIAIVIIGGITVIENFPSFCSELVKFFQQKSLIYEYPDTKWIAYDFIKTLIGYLLITNHKRIALFIDKQVKS